MTREAQQAIASSIQLELKKDGLSQRQSGDWSLRFTIAATDMDQRLTAAAMGTRYACVLVEINDVEEAVDHQAVVRDKWRELGPVKQSALRCKDPVFWAFLEEQMHFSGVNTEHRAAAIVRDWCKVDSRSELGRPGYGDRRALWHDLDNRFHAWKAAEHA